MNWDKATLVTLFILIIVDDPFDKRGGFDFIWYAGSALLTGLALGIVWFILKKVKESIR